MSFKKRIYIAHSSDTNYHDEIYKPLRESKLNDIFEITFPHEFSNEHFNSREYVKLCYYVVAEVSEEKLGLGIELGWADLYGVPIVCILKKGKLLSQSLNVISKDFIEYSDHADLTIKLMSYFNIS